MSPIKIDPAWVLAVLGVLLTQGVVFFRWIYRKMRDDDINRKFVRALANNHLPHIYHALRQLCEGSGIELTEPPPIEFVDFYKNGNGKH